MSDGFEDLEFGQTIGGLLDGQRVFERFTLRRLLGRGGMGLVWLARDEQLEMEVALKFLPRLDEAGMEELKRETRRSMALIHPNIVRVYDIVEESGSAAIAMEYVDGATLRVWQMVQPNRIFKAADIMPWVKQICAATEYAHTTAHIVHGDLKPSNLMLDHRGRIKVTDFGMVRSLINSMNRLAIQPVGFSGTLAYMSPQQARGVSASPLDDVYSLGATLYELLTSRPPFCSGKILHRIPHVPPVSISQCCAELGITSKPAPAAWEMTIRDCLAHEPSERPPSVAAVWSRLNRSHGAGRVPPGTNRKPKIRTSLLAAALLGLLVFGSAAWWWYGGGASRPPKAVALKSSVSAQEKAQEQAQADQIRLEKEKAVAELAAEEERQRLAVEESRLAAEKAKTDEAEAAEKIAAENRKVAEMAKASKSAGQSQALANATREVPFENSLGMKFVPVPGIGVLFSVWDTRVKDYQAFCEATARELKKPPFEQTADDPAVMVSWEDAHAFCEWLTEKDRKDAKIREDQKYRLPTDAEWSAAVGTEKYPWGNAWPPPKSAGNFDPSLGVDEYVNTSPCSSFRPNDFGLCDMGGNVWQWCEDWYRAEMNEKDALEKYPELNEDGGGEKYRVLRGGSWHDVGLAGRTTSPRSYVTPEYRLSDGGFRCVLGPSSH